MNVIFAFIVGGVRSLVAQTNTSTLPLLVVGYVRGIFFVVDAIVKYIISRRVSNVYLSIIDINC